MELNLIFVFNKVEIIFMLNIFVQGIRCYFFYMYLIFGFEIVEIIVNFDIGWFCRYDLLLIS